MALPPWHAELAGGPAADAALGTAVLSTARHPPAPNQREA